MIVHLIVREMNVAYGRNVLDDMELEPINKFELYKK